MEDLNTMNDIGYNVSYKLANASDYGVPQNRQRVLFVGTRKDLNIEFEFPKKQEKEKLTLGDILDIPADVENQVDWPLSPQAMEMLVFKLSQMILNLLMIIRRILLQCIKCSEMQFQ